jgi:hypothetical protein
MALSNFKPVRRTQLISPFGVGAMVDFPRDEALMTAGLDAWPYAFEKCPPEWMVIEERLQARLGTTHFRLPPDFRTDDIDPRYVRQQIPYVRFPRWHFCPAFGCGRMVERPLFGAGAAVCRDPKHKGVPEHQLPRVVPVRFVAVCPQGHVEDFPFMEWVHRGRELAEGEEHILYYKAGGSAALSGIKIRCSCNDHANLGGAFNYDPETGGALHNRIGYDCRGQQPWLGQSENSVGSCGGYLRAVQRGASNVYFPKTLSSIYLPLWGEQTNPRIIRILEDAAIWGQLSNGLDEGLYVSKERIEMVAAMRGVDPSQLQEAAQRKLDGGRDEVDASDEEFRRSEYEAIQKERGGEGTDLLVEALDISLFDGWLAPYFERICLVRKLRETRVLAGFSRLLPPGADGEETSVQLLSKSGNIGWLPAQIVKGEGIFIEFKLQTIDKWLATSDIEGRISELSNAYNQALVRRNLPAIVITPKLVLLHTFAHMLIRQLSFDCGYGSASLRERIYCEREPDASSMQGVLIYTAAGDSEGTMGGLVRKGEPGNLESSLRLAIASAAWCSSDPVCVESPGQGSDSANLAACHGCALLPETSCEEGNRLLDRATISGTPSYPEIGFFNDLLNH